MSFREGDRVRVVRELSISSLGIVGCRGVVTCTYDTGGSRSIRVELDPVDTNDPTLHSYGADYAWLPPECLELERSGLDVMLELA